MSRFATGGAGGAGAGGAVLHAVPLAPLAMHAHHAARLSDAQRVQFEAVLETADDAVLACMQARQARQAPPAPVSTGDAAEMVQLMIKTVCAVTGAEAPATLDSKRAVVRWLSDSITRATETAVCKATQNNLAPGMDPREVATCMELMTKLNTLMNGGAHAAC